MKLEISLNSNFQMWFTHAPLGNLFELFSNLIYINTS